MSLSPPRPKGPPLNSLRAFEAAARLGSFVAAAEELTVTPGAVSQHIKALESWAGVDLFRRRSKGVELTSAGRRLAPEFTTAFDAIGAASHLLRNLGRNADIHIAALPSIAQQWLPTRLGQIRRAYSHMRFSVTALETAPVLSREMFDLSLFFADPDESSDKICVADDRIFPVCAPNLREQLDDPEKLNEFPLLQDQTWKDDWALWSNSAGVAIDDPTNGPGYSLYSLAIEEAKSGAGVLMGHEALISQALLDGSLVQAFPQTARTGRALILELPHRSIRRPELSGIAELLLAG